MDPSPEFGVDLTPGPSAAHGPGVSVRHFDGQSALARSAWLSRAGSGGLQLNYADGHQRLLGAAELTLEPALPGLPRELRLTDGGRWRCADQAGLAALLEAFPLRREAGQRLLGWERNWRLVVGGLVLTLGALVLGFFVGIPFLAGVVARRMPLEALGVASDQTFALLEQLELRPSELDEAQQQELRERFGALTEAVPGGYRFRLELRMAVRLGANAFALPDGRVVVTDALVKLLDGPELEAVLLHELGHVVHRHGAQLVLRAAALTLLLSLVSGDVSGLGALGSGLPAILLQQGYSRGFESEADRFAGQWLMAEQRSTAALQQALQKLGGISGAEGDGSGALLASHPAIAERVQALEAMESAAR